MKKNLLLLLAAAAMLPVDAEQIELNGNPHEVNELISMSIGPGITYKRLRSETYPLNINMLIMDVTNPYNRLETTTANESSQGTEMLVNAAKRQTTDEKRVIAGANANFWVVSTSVPYSPLLLGMGYGGSGRNGQMITETNMYSDQWNGWQRAGIVGIDVDKMLHIGNLYYRGYVKHDKVGSPEIHQINKVVRDGEIGLYNSFYGASRTFLPVNQGTSATTGKAEFTIVEGESTEVLLDFVDGEKWKIGEPVKMTVAEVRTDAGTGTLGSHDAALVGRGDKRALLANLAVGDELTIETNYYDRNNQLLKLDNFVAGNAAVMIGGELTQYNNTDSYNSQVYSRTGYGMSADGKTLYVMVIDRSTDKTYGKSAGCPTRVMCEIAKHYGCTDMVNCDAGGSAEMYYNGAIINTTTEGTPRAVSNGMFLYSIAPKDDNVTRLEFYDVNLLAPTYSSFSPQIIAYNQYGDVVDYDFKDYTLSCSEALGACDGNVFIAGGTATTGPLTATYNGVSVSKDITVAASSAAMRIKPLVIDHIREYTMEVTATVGANTYNYDPTRLSWNVEDETVAVINDQGVLKGLKNGKTTISVNIGDFVDTTHVSVEIPTAKYLPVTDFTGWTFKQSGTSGTKMDETGRVDFKVAVSRLAPSVELIKLTDLFSLPEAVWVEFESDLTVDKVHLDVRTPVATRTNYVEQTNEGQGFAALSTYRVKFPLSAYGDLSDLISFPMTLSGLKFTFPKDASLNGDHYIQLKALETEYLNPSGVEDVAIQDANAAVGVAPNPVVDGVANITSNSELRSVMIYSASGVLVGRQSVSGNRASVNVSGLSAGLYIAVVETANGITPVRIVVK